MAIRYSGQDGYILSEEMLVDGLPPVRPRTKSKRDPDEPFFIRTHHVFEIWFAQTIQELEFVRELLGKENVPETDIPKATHHLRRASAIFEILKAHLPLLETLSTTAFFDFRSELKGASGLDSYRFREVEWLLGLRDDSLLEYLRSRKNHLPGEGKRRASLEEDAVEKYQRDWKHEELPALHKSDSAQKIRALGQRDAERTSLGEKRFSVRGSVLGWLKRTPFPDPAGKSHPADAVEKPFFYQEFLKRFREQYIQAFLHDYRDDDGKDKLAEVGERFDAFMKRTECAAAAFILQFAHQPLLAWPAALVEAALELDEAFMTWRTRHISMVARVLGGGRVSTKGREGSGLGYLEGTLSMRAFPEFWDARTFLLGEEEARATYEDNAWQFYRLKIEEGKQPWWRNG